MGFFETVCPFHSKGLESILGWLELTCMGMVIIAIMGMESMGVI